VDAAQCADARGRRDGGIRQELAESGTAGAYSRSSVFLNATAF
jgi:hypothetical protein